MGKTMVPMFASSIAVVTNTALNFLLIFGLFFFPTLGVQGAAISTLIARIVECAITMYWVHRHEEENPFAIRVYHQFHVPLHLVKQILRKGSPLMANEILLGDRADNDHSSLFCSRTISDCFLEHLIHRLQFVQYCLYGTRRCRCGHGRATSWSR